MESCPDPVEVSEHSPLHTSCSASPTDSVTWRWLLSNGSASDFQTDTSNTCVMFNVSDITICRNPSKTSFHAANVSRDLFGGASLTCQVGSGVSHSCLIDVIREYPPIPHTHPSSVLAHHHRQLPVLCSTVSAQTPSTGLRHPASSHCHS